MTNQGKHHMQGGLQMANGRNQSELEQKIFSLTVETGRKFMKTRVLEDWTLSKQIMELVNAYITANYTTNSEAYADKAKLEFANDMLKMNRWNEQARTDELYKIIRQLREKVGRDD